MELRHLRYFLAVADAGGLVRAAERLRVAQPALSRQIRDFERELGVRLFERSPQAIRLTPAGEAVRTEGSAIFDHVARAMEHARRSTRGLAGRCTLCVGKLPTWNDIIARLVTTVRRDWPLVELDVSEGVGFLQWDAVRSGKADLGVGIAPTDAFTDLESAEIAVQPFDAALLPATHRLAKHSRIRMAELASEPIIAVATDSDHYRMCAEVARLVTPPAPIHVGESVSDVFAQVTIDNGWTPFARSLAEWAPPGTAVVSVEGLHAALRLHVIWRRGALRPVVRTVRDLLVAAASAGAAATRGRGALRSAEATDSADRDVPNASVPLALELRHLHYFLAVVAERSIGRAAQRLSITQPTLSRQMRDLERMMGVELLERRTRGVIATTAGLALAADAERILDRAHGIGPEAHRATRGAEGRCLVAAIPPAIVSHVLASFLSLAAAELPDARIGITDVPTPLQPEALLSGEADVGICHAFTSITPFLSRLRNERLLDDAVCSALLAHDHPLAARDEISLSDLADLPFLFMPRSLYPAFHDRVMTLFAAHDFHPRITQSYDGLQTTWALARRGGGWCIGFRTSLRFPPAGLVAVPVRELDLPWGIELLSRRDEARPIVLGVLDLIRRAAAGEAHRWTPDAGMAARGSVREVTR